MRHLGRLLFFLTCVLAVPRLGIAATCTWSGGGSDNNWSTAANWDNCGGAHATPQDGDDLVFPGGAARNTPNDDLPTLTVGTIAISGVPASGTGYLVTGVGVAVAGGLMSFNAPPDFFGQGPSWRVPLSLRAPTAINVDGSDAFIVASGDIFTNGHPLTVAASTANLTIASAIKDQASITKNGPKSLSLIVASGPSLSGTLTINDGVLFLGGSSEQAFKTTGAVVNAGGTLSVNVPLGGPLTLNGGQLEGGFTVGVATGPLTVSTDSVVNVLTTMAFTGAISGTGTLHKINDGTLVLSGTSPAFTGTLSVDRGRLIVDGNMSATPIAITGGALSGAGTTGPVTGTGGSFGPGGARGALHTKDVTLNHGAFAADIIGFSAGEGYPQVKVTGAVNLTNATLATPPPPGPTPIFPPSITPPTNSVFTLIDNDGTDPVIGTFNGLPEGATLTVGPASYTISYVGGSGNDVVLVAQGPNPQYFLSEGATGPFFDEDILIANPNPVEAQASIRYDTAAGVSVSSQLLTLPPRSRRTIHVDQEAGLDGAEASARITSSTGVPLVVERSMFWDQSYYAGHTGSAVEQASQDWVFAEGSQGFFSTFILLHNPDPAAVDVTLTFLREAGSPPFTKRVTVAGAARFTVDCSTISEIANQSFGINVHAAHPIIAERSMYFGTTPTRLWSGGHESAGVSAPAKSWFLAEGATGGFFDTFVLMANAQSTPANVTIQFLLDTGETVTEQKVIPANGRLTINIEAEPDPRLANAAVSTVVTSDVPIVVERSMYWIGDVVPWTEAHNSFGVVDSGFHWGLAEGRVGGPLNYHTYVLLANPETTAAEVTVTFLRENGKSPIVKMYTVPPTSRFNIDVNLVSPELHDEYVGVDVKVTNGPPIIVERSMYWDSGGVLFKGGTNATGVRLP